MIMNNYEQIKVEHIKEQYTERKTTPFDELRALDRKVKKPAQIFAYTFGAIGSLVLGAGMSFAMGVIGNSMALGIAIGLVGIALVSVTYPIYKKILNSRKQKYAKQILALSDELLNK